MSGRARRTTAWSSHHEDDDLTLAVIAETNDELSFEANDAGDEVVIRLTIDEAESLAKALTSHVYFARLAERTR